MTTNPTEPGSPEEFMEAVEIIKDMGLVVSNVPGGDDAQPPPPVTLPPEGLVTFIDKELPAGNLCFRSPAGDVQCFVLVQAHWVPVDEVTGE